MIKKYLFTLVTLFSFYLADAQIFTSDKNGHISDPKFQKLIKSHGFELVSSVDTLQRYPSLIIAASFQKNGKWGRIDNHGKIIDEAKAMDLATNVTPREIKGDPFADRDEPHPQPVVLVHKAVFLKYSKNGVYGTRDATGKEGIQAIFSQINFLNDSTVRVKLGSQYGASTADGKIIVPAEYDNVTYAYNSEQAFAIQKGKFVGVWYKGKETIPVQYDRVAFDDHYKNLVKVTSNDKTALFTLDGNQLSPFDYSQINSFFASGVALYRIDGGMDTKMGLIDTQGKRIPGSEHAYITGFSTRLLRVMDGERFHEKYGLMDQHGKLVSQQDYSRIDYLSDGLVRVTRDNKMGFIDTTGHEVVKPNYSNVDYFSKDGVAIIRIDNKYGMINKKDEVVVQPIYTRIEQNTARQIYIIEQEGKRGLLDKHAKIVLPPTYDILYAVNEYGYLVGLDHKQGMLNDDGKIMVPIKYDQIEPQNQHKILEHGIIRAVLNGKKCRVDLYGNEYFTKAAEEKTTGFVPDKKGYVSGPAFAQFIKEKGFQLVSAFDTLERHPLLMAARVMLDGKWQYIDTKGQFVAGPETSRYTYSDVKMVDMRGGNADITIPVPDNQSSSGFEQVNVNGKYGTLNKTTNQVGLPAIYDGLTFMGHGWVMIRLSGKYGMAMDDGKVMLPPQYESITPGVNNGKFTFEQFFVRNGGKYGLVSSNGTEIIPLKYDQLLSAESFGNPNQLLKFSVEKKWGLMTKKGKVSVEPTYDELNIFYPGIFKTVVGGYPKKYGLIDTTGKVLLDPVYKNIESDIFKKLIHITLTTDKGDKQGYLSYTGKVLFKPVYDEVNILPNGMTIVSLNHKWGLITENEKFIMQPVYDRLYVNSESGLVIVEVSRKKGAFDTKGNRIIPIEYDQLYPDGENIVFNRNEKWGIMTRKEKILTLLDYNSISPGHDCFIVGLNGKYGLMANDGKLITPIKYSRFQGDSFTMRQGIAEMTLNGKKGIIDYYGNEYFLQ